MNWMRRITHCTKFVFFILFFHFGLNPLATKAQPKYQIGHIDEVIDKFQLFVEETLLEWNAPGAAVAIVSGDSIVFMRGFGVREVGKPQPIDVNTVFRLASVSKGFASVLTGMLVQQNLLRWDDPVKKYLPSFALHDSQATRNLTIRHVLSHTSGLPPHAFTNLLEEEVSYSEILAQLQGVPSAFPVGQMYAYQNVLYSIIGDVVFSVTGQPYEDLVEQYIFEPLGMHQASLGKVSFLMSANRAEPHTNAGFDWIVSDVEDCYYKVPPSAGVNASISDMAKWLRAMMGGNPDILSSEVISKVTTPFAATPRDLYKYRWRDHLRKAHYGLGWRIYMYNGVKIVYHGGWVKGFRAEIAFMPEQKVGIVALINSESKMANLFLPTFFDLYMNVPIKEAAHHTQ